METRDQQVKHVGQGLALGVLAHNPAQMTASKMTVEFAFNHAWRRWGRASEFPSITGHDPGNMIWLGMGKSERRAGAIAAWSRNRVLEPYVLYEGWSITECLDLVADERANAHDWMELGGLFVEGMSR